MKVAVSGYRGLIGSQLEKELTDNGHHVVRLDRELLYDRSLEQLAISLKGTDAVVHLSGAPIIQRWTSKNRKIMYDSRIITTRNIAGAIGLLAIEERPKVMVSASAIGLYQVGKLHAEDSYAFADHFAARLIIDWEEANAMLPEDTRSVIFRIGLVLDSKAELIKRLKLPFLLYAGGPIGNGAQPFPFIHLHDVTGAIQWAISQTEVKGVYNLTAPEQITNGQFSAELGKRLNRPSWFPVPKLPLRVLFGEAAQLVFESPAIEPRRLKEENFIYQFPTLHLAMNQLFNQLPLSESTA